MAEILLTHTIYYGRDSPHTQNMLWQRFSSHIKYVMAQILLTLKICYGRDSPHTQILYSRFSSHTKYMLWQRFSSHTNIIWQNFSSHTKYVMAEILLSTKYVMAEILLTHKICYGRDSHHTQNMFWQMILLSLTDGRRLPFARTTNTSRGPEGPEALT